jgi:transcription-repair coupling factor (superfamily II helicase)
MLEEAVQKLKGVDKPDTVSAQLNLGIALRIDEQYVPEENQRLRLYKKIAGATDAGAVTELRAELEDRYGMLPDATVYLLEAAEIRLLAEQLGIAQVDRKRNELHLKFTEKSIVDPAQLMRVVKSHAKRGAQFTPQGVFKYPLKATRPDELLLELRELISSLEPATAIRA